MVPPPNAAHSDTASNINPPDTPSTPCPGPAAAAQRPQGHPPCHGGWSVLGEDEGGPHTTSTFSPGKRGSIHPQAWEVQERHLGVTSHPRDLPFLEEVGSPGLQHGGHHGERVRSLFSILRGWSCALCRARPQGFWRLQCPRGMSNTAKFAVTHVCAGVRACACVSVCVSAFLTTRIPVLCSSYSNNLTDLRSHSRSKMVNQYTVKSTAPS